MNTLQTEETPGKQGIRGRARTAWARLLVKGADPSPALTSPRSARATIVIAAIPSAASLVWTAWSLMEMIPAPWMVGLAAGVVLDVALVSAVAIAWIAPQVAKPAKVTGWLIALLAAALVGFHAFTIMPVLAGLGLIPLVAKGLWHLALSARLARAAAEAAQEEADRKAAEEKAKRDAELSTDPKHEEKKLVAEKRRQARHEKELAVAEVELEDAKAERDHKLKLAKIRRDAEQQRAMDREDAAVIKQRIELTREINASQPASFALPAGEAPNDLSTMPASPSASLMGFGSAMGTAPKSSRTPPLELEARAREVYSPGMSLNAFRQALGVGMTKAHPLHQKLRAESEATG